MSQDPMAGELRRADCALLKPGVILAGNLYDRSGRVLVRRGERLDGELLRRLAARQAQAVYIGPDWETPATVSAATASDGRADVERPLSRPGEVVEELRRHARGERRTRRHARHAWRVRLKVVICNQPDSGPSPRAVTVMTCDISLSGFSFLFNQYVHPGTRVYPCFETLPSRPVMKAVVRDCVHVEGRQHRVGVEFAEWEPGEGIPPL